MFLAFCRVLGGGQSHGEVVSCTAGLRPALTGRADALEFECLEGTGFRRGTDVEQRCDPVFCVW